MAIEIAVATGDISQTVSTEVDFTSTGFGTVDAAIVVTGKASSGVNPATSIRNGIGFYDGTNQVGIGMASLSGGGTTNCSRGVSVASVVNIPTYGGTGTVLRATASAQTDGIKLTTNVSTVSIDEHAFALLLKGVTNAGIVSHSMDGTTSANNITGFGFQPDVVFFLSKGGTTASYQTHVCHQFGVAHNSSTGIVQGALGFYDRDALGTTASGTRISDTVCLQRQSSDTLTWTLSASDFDANGLSITSSAGTSNVVYMLGLKLPDQDDVNVQVIDSNTSATTKATTGCGFEPVGLFLAQSMCTAVNTVTGEGSIGFGATDGTSEYSINALSEDAASTMNSEANYSSTDIVDLDFDAGTDDALASFSSFDSDGFTLNYSDGSASARKLLAITFGDSTSGLSPIWFHGQPRARQVNDRYNPNTKR